LFRVSGWSQRVRHIAYRKLAFIQADPADVLENISQNISQNL